MKIYKFPVLEDLKLGIVVNYGGFLTETAMMWVRDLPHEIGEELPKPIKESSDETVKIYNLSRCSVDSDNEILDGQYLLWGRKVAYNFLRTSTSLHLKSNECTILAGSDKNHNGQLFGWIAQAVEDTVISILPYKKHDENTPAEFAALISGRFTLETY